MDREKSKGIVGFEVTDTILLEIDARLAGMAGESRTGSTGFGIDFGAALDQMDDPELAAE